MRLFKYDSTPQKRKGCCWLSSESNLLMPGDLSGIYLVWMFVV